MAKVKGQNGKGKSGKGEKPVEQVEASGGCWCAEASCYACGLISSSAIWTWDLISSSACQVADAVMGCVPTCSSEPQPAQQPASRPARRSSK